MIGTDRTVLLKEVLSSGVWTVQGEMAVRGWNAQAKASPAPMSTGAASICPG